MSADAPFPALAVCTGSTCRSPVAGRVGSVYLTEVHGEGAGVRLVGAGTRALVGSPTDSSSVRVFRQLGGESCDFRATQLSEDSVDTADLTLTTTRSHRAGVLARAPRATTRTFTLREAGRLLGLVDDTEHVPGGPQERAGALGKRMVTCRSRWPSGPGEDITDSLGQDTLVHGRTARPITDALTQVLGRLVQVLDHRTVGVLR